MGLDCYIPGAPGKGGRIGSYSGVHRLREILMVAALEFVKNGIINLTYPVLFRLFWQDSIKDNMSSDALNKLINQNQKKLTFQEIWHWIVELQESATWEDTEQTLRFESDDDNDHLAMSYLITYKIIKDWYDPQPEKPNIIDTGDNGFQQLMQQLASIMKVQLVNIAKCDLENEPTYQELMLLNLSGLKKFIHHSDCQGQYSPGDCLDISLTMKQLTPFIKDHDERKWMQEIARYFKKAFKLRKPLILC